MSNSNQSGSKELLYLDDVRVGQRFVSGTHRIDEVEIKAFAQQFDPQPFHLDAVAAKDTLFEGLVASGWHTAAVTMRLLVEGLPIAGGIVGAGGEIAWPKPTRPGAVLYVESEIVELRPSRSRPDRGTATIRSETRNQFGEIVQVFTAKLIVPRRAVAANVPDRARFESIYAGKPPWDIGKPQQPFVAVAERVTSPILDAGCGTGDNALFFSARGHRVTGIDFLEVPIQRARAKAAELGQSVEFLVKDATTLADWGERFASVIDCGLFHVFSDDDRRRYVQGLARVIDLRGQLFLLCFSDEEPGMEGPRRVSRQELYDAFADGWEVESVEPCRVEVTPEFTDIKFSAGGPKAWFAVIRRTG